MKPVQLRSRPLLPGGLWLGVAWCLVALACSKPNTQSVAADVKVATELIDFGDVYVGGTRTRPVTIANRGVPSAELVLTAPVGFSVESPLTVPGGTELLVDVTFTATEPGDVTVDLDVRIEDTHVTVPLHARALAQPSCPSTPCTDGRFSLDAGACESLNHADDSACLSGCNVAGRCQAGECLASNAGRCEDADPCTVDGCADDGGCVHNARVCPVSSACRVASCEPARGCVETDLTDGIACGPSTCATANICLNGECARRPRPNAEENCTYTGIGAFDTTSCALARSGVVRCWGTNDKGQLGRGFASSLEPPGELPLNARAKALASGDQVCAVLENDEAQCLPTGSLDAGQLVESVAHARGRSCLALLDGGLQCDIASSGDVTGPVAKVVVGEAHACGLRPDGGVVCWGDVRGVVDDSVMSGDVVAERPLPEAAVLVRAGGNLSCAVLASGAAECWGQRARSGLPARLPGPWRDLGLRQAPVGAPSWPVLAGVLRDGGVMSCNATCRREHDGGFDNGFVALASGTGHVCALAADGGAWCWGDARGVGDLLRLPVTPVDVPTTSLRLLALGDTIGVGVLASGSVVQWGSAQPMPRTLSFSSPGALDVMSIGDSLCVLEPGVARCEQWTTRRPYRVSGLPADVSSFIRQPTCARSATQGVWCWGRTADGGVADELTAVAVPDRVVDLGESRSTGVPLRCVVEADGGVSCVGVSFDGQLGQGASVVSASTAVAVDVSGIAPVRRVEVAYDFVCALGVNGGVRCWGRMPGGSVQRPAPVPGLSPLVRTLGCGSGHCCALSGQNHVQCFGVNYSHQLGGPGPWSVSAVTVPMGVAVKSLAVAGNSSCALLMNGRARCWGDNQVGQLGVNPLQFAQTPVFIEQ